MRKRILDIPPELKSKVPTDLMDFYSWRHIALVCGPAIGVLITWLTSGQQENGFDYFAPLLIYPWISSLYFIIFPKNPYRGMVLGYSTRLNGLDRDDADARRLVRVYASAAARRVILISTLKITAFFFLNGLLIVLFHYSSLSWQLSACSFSLGPIATAYLIGTFLYVGVVHSIWGFEIWIEQSKEKGTRQKNQYKVVFRR